MNIEQEALNSNLSCLSKPLRYKLVESLKSTAMKNDEQNGGIKSLLETQEEENIIIKYKALREAQNLEKLRSNDLVVPLPGQKNLDKEKVRLSQMKKETQEFMDKYTSVVDHVKKNMPFQESKFQQLVALYRSKGYRVEDIEHMKNIFNPSLLLLEDYKIDKYCQNNTSNDNEDKTTQEFQFLNNLYKISFQQSNSGYSNNAIGRSNDKFATYSAETKLQFKDLGLMVKEARQLEVYNNRMKEELKNMKQEAKKEEMLMNNNINSSKRINKIKKKNKELNRRKRKVTIKAALDTGGYKDTDTYDKYNKFKLNLMKNFNSLFNGDTHTNTNNKSVSKNNETNDSNAHDNNNDNGKSNKNINDYKKSNQMNDNSNAIPLFKNMMRGYLRKNSVFTNWDTLKVQQNNSLLPLSHSPNNKVSSTVIFKNKNSNVLPSRNYALLSNIPSPNIKRVDSNVNNSNSVFNFSNIDENQMNQLNPFSKSSSIRIELLRRISDLDSSLEKQEIVNRLNKNNKNITHSYANNVVNRGNKDNVKYKNSNSRDKTGNSIYNKIKNTETSSYNINNTTIDNSNQYTVLNTENNMNNKSNSSNNNNNNHSVYLKTDIINDNTDNKKSNIPTISNLISSITKTKIKLPKITSTFSSKKQKNTSTSNINTISEKNEKTSNINHKHTAQKQSKASLFSGKNINKLPSIEINNTIDSNSKYKEYTNNSYSLNKMNYNNTNTNKNEILNFSDNKDNNNLSSNKNIIDINISNNNKSISNNNTITTPKSSRSPKKFTSMTKEEVKRKQHLDFIFQSIKCKDNKNLKQMILDYNNIYTKTNNNLGNSFLYKVSVMDIVNTMDDTKNLIKKYDIINSFKDTYEMKCKGELERIKQLEKQIQKSNFDLILAVNKV